MDSLIVSGIVYTPLGDEEYTKSNAVWRFNDLSSQSLPIKIRGFSNRYDFGELLDIKIKWVNGCPIYYGLGIINNTEAIKRIIATSFNKKLKFKSYTFSEQLHSFCMGMNLNQKYTYRKSIEEDLWCYDEFQKKSITKTKEIIHEISDVEIMDFYQLHVVHGPCCKFTSIYLPHTFNYQNSNLITAHKDVMDYSESDEAFYKKIKMNNKLFDSLFGKYDFSKKKFGNILNNGDLKKFFEVSNKIVDNIPKKEFKLKQKEIYEK